MNNLLKIKAVKLRKAGLSYGDIKKKLNISKSTLSYWLKNVKLTKEQRKKLYTNSILILSRGVNSQKERRKREIDKITNEAEKEIKFPLSEGAFQLFGAALYWAEGRKTNGLSITNSDPHLILFIVKWFEKIFKISPNDLKAWLNIYPQQNDFEIKQFWSQLTGIPIERFGKSYIKPLNKNYKKNTLYYGTITVAVSRGTDMRYKIFGWIKSVLRDVSRTTEITQQRWKKLTEISRAINISEDIKN